MNRSRPGDFRPFVAYLVYTSAQVARLFGTSPRSVAKWIDEGLIPGYRLPGSKDRRVDHADLVAWLRARPEYASVLARLEPGAAPPPPPPPPPPESAPCTTCGRTPTAWDGAPWGVTGRVCDGCCDGLIAAARDRAGLVTATARNGEGGRP